MLPPAAKIALVAGAFALFLGYGAANLIDANALPDAPPPPIAAQPAALAPASAAPAPRLREVSIPVGARGQYFTEVEVNRRAVRMLVDTGATGVAISAATAERLGLSYVGEPVMLSTAGGAAKGARVKLDLVAVGGIELRAVDAFVLPKDAGDVNLLGMSFLGRLAGVEEKNGALVLRQ